MNTVQTLKITSFSNPKVKYVSKLKDKKFRDQEKRFFLEGYRECNRAYLSKRIQIEELFICKELFLGKNENTLIKQINTHTIELTVDIFRKISYRDRPDGIIAIAKTPNWDFNYHLDNSIRTVVIIEGVEKPGNLGTILRTTDGAGIHNIFISDSGLDLFNPNIIRSSTGGIFFQNVYKVEIKKIIPYLKEKQFEILALTPEAKLEYSQYDFREKKIALIFGSEQYGLSEYAKKNTDILLSLPMKGYLDSLNLAMSVGIVSYEILRQNTNFINP